MDEIIKTIEEVAKQILSLAGFESAVFVREEGGGFFVEIKEKEKSGLLIGQEGKNLLALQHILKVIVYKKTGQIVPLVLDVEGYYKKHQDQLKKEALEAAAKVLKTKRPFVFRPMNSFERKIIHLILASHPDVMTESIGVEPNRRVVVKIKS